MIKNNTQLLKQLVCEIESIINNSEIIEVNHINSAPQRPITDLNYTALLYDSRLHNDLVNELGYLIRTYGSALIYFVNQNCPPMSVILGVSTFIFEEEKEQFSKLKKQLNRYLDLEDIPIYRINDYLILGYPFFDCLFYVYFYRVKVGKYNAWNLVSNTEYEKPIYLENQKNNEKTSGEKGTGEKISSRNKKLQPKY